MEAISPTRMNLILKKEEISSARAGAELLRNKRDVLLREFFISLKGLLSAREALQKQANQALQSFVFALGLEGREKLLSFSFIKPQPPNVKIDYKNLLGLKIPGLVVEPAPDDEAPNSIDTSVALQEAKDDFRDFLNQTLNVLPQELRLKRLGREIKNTTRKVNSLEKYVLPQLGACVKFIREALEEREREDIFRLKRFKKRLERYYEYGICHSEEARSADEESK